MGINRELMIIIASLLIILIYFVRTYFYSSFLVCFSSKSLLSTDTLLQSVKKQEIQIYSSKAIPEPGIRPLLTTAWFNECSHNLWTAFDLNCTPEFRDSLHFRSSFFSPASSPIQSLSCWLPFPTISLSPLSPS